MQNMIAIKITEAEWEIMRVVWANGAVTSRAIIQTLEDKMQWKAATIKTLIGRLVDKEALETKQDGRKFIYSAKITETDSMASFSEDILSRVCKKHNSHVVKSVIQDATLSKEDIGRLIDLLKEKQITAPAVVPCECNVGQCECQMLLEEE